MTKGLTMIRPSPRTALDDFASQSSFACVRVLTKRLKSTMLKSCSFNVARCQGFHRQGIHCQGAH